MTKSCKHTQNCKQFGENFMTKPITIIATIGSSPAVLTEAVYALHQKKMGPVTEVEIITTSHGAERVKQDLFGKNKQWIGLCDELGIDPYSIKIPFKDEIRGVKTEDGNELEDIRNRDEDQIMASEIQRIVRKHTEDPNKRVFAVLSGGRKTMSSHLMSAMQLFSRRDDRLLHLLVSDPFEKVKDFYYPTRESKKLELKTMKGEFVKNVDAKDAVIDLIDIPYIRLRSYLSTKIDFSKSYDQLIAEADEQLLSAEEYPVNDFQIHLNGAESRLYINGLENGCDLEPRQLAMLSIYVWLNLEQGRPYDLSWHDIVKEEERRRALSIFYRTATEGNYEKADEKARAISVESFNEKDEWLDYDYWHDENDEPLKRSFSKNKSVFTSKLNEFLKSTPLLDVKLEHIWQESGSASRTVKKLYKVPVPVKFCRITGLHEKDAEQLNLL
jgi:CRISPR-associated protein (TIGR02584 family)